MIIFSFLKIIIIIIVIFIVILCTSIKVGWEFPKDDILNVYNTVIQTFSFKGLTKDSELTGKRKFGIDKYVGTYNAKYKYATGTEDIFGGTALHRKNGSSIKLKIKVNKQSGNIKVINKLGDNEMTLLEGAGEYEDTIYIDGMSYYLSIKLEQFTGNIDIISE